MALVSGVWPLNALYTQVGVRGFTQLGMRVVA